MDGEVRLTYAELAGRCARLVSALAAAGVEPGDRVAALCANSHVMLELHHAVPARGAVLVSVNIRLSDDEMRYVLEHSGARLLVATRELADRARALADELDIQMVAEEEYDAWRPVRTPSPPTGWRSTSRHLLALNYTSGTTGRPKGVMYHHRGAYLQAVAMAYHARLGPGACYLWTLPMFHCNGWCFTWAVTAAGGTHLCLRAVDASEIWRLLREEGVTHFSGAPTVLAMIAADPGDRARPPRPRRHRWRSAVTRADRPARSARPGRHAPLRTHRDLRADSDQRVVARMGRADADERNRLRARQGVGNIVARPLRVLDHDGPTYPRMGRPSASSPCGATT